MSIDGIRFGIWDSEDIIRRSVVEIKVGRSFSNGVTVPTGPFDERLGAWRNLYDKCPTCRLTGALCLGHFGHYVLPEPMIHPLFVRSVLSILNENCCYCFKRHIGNATCAQCSARQSTLVQNKNKCNSCNADLISFLNCGHCGHLKCTWEVKSNGLLYPSNESFDSELVTREGFFKMLLNIPSVKRYIMTVLPIPPSIIRTPNITSGQTVRGQNDMTLNIVEIIKISTEFRKQKGLGAMDRILNDIREALFTQISLYISNSTTSASDHFKKNSTNLQGVLDRLKGKQGRFRLNLMGKRSNYTARTVVSGDANLGIGELGVPKSIANTLTKPVRINACNEIHWNQVMSTDPERIKRIEDGEGTQINLNYVSKSNVILCAGHIIHRVLQDGDWVLFNRQPSLHKQSLMAHRIRVLPYSSFRMNLSATSPYNADFDGDEMNMHVPQTLLATADISEICAVSQQFISKTNNKPIMGIVQDSLLTAYRATASEDVLSEIIWNGALCTLDFSAIKRGDDIARVGGKRYGKDLVSLILPSDFFYQRGSVNIENGILITGTLTKKDIGASNGSIIHNLVNDYSGKRAARFINDFQRVMLVYMIHSGFSVGLSDCLLSEKALDLIKQANEKTELHLKELILKKEPTFEAQANRVLNRNRDITGRIAIEDTDIENRFTNMTGAGSKGSAINISQIMACVGQQNVNGKRIESRVHGRTLPQFKVGDRGADACGYVKHSYVEGLNPHEFFFHTMAGREGLVDTAIKTAGTGYLQRRLVKGMENIQVEYDSSARDIKKIIQFKYGEDGRDSEQIELQKLDFLLLKKSEFIQHFVLKSNKPEVVEIKNSVLLFEKVDMVRDTNSRFDRVFPLAVPLSRLIKKHLRFHKNIRSFKTIEDVFEDAPLKNLYIRWKKFPPIYTAFFTATLASKRLVKYYKFNARQLSGLLSDIDKYWQRSKCVPGECVGAVAAQSVGEPATQLTLNTFHFAGVSAKNVTLGVPRLSELINCSSAQKTPQTFIFFKAPINQNLQDILKIQKKIAPIRISSLVDKYTFEIHKTAPAYKYFDLFPDDNVNVLTGGLFASLHLNRNECNKFGVCLSDFITALYRILTTGKSCKYRIIYPEDADIENSIIYIGFSKPHKKQNNTEVFFHPNYADLFDTMKKLISNSFIGGIDGIKNASVSRYKRKTYRNGVLAVDPEWIMHVAGSRLKEICQMNAVDATRIFSNDVRDMRQMFGIEIARTSMKNEIRKVLQFDGSYLNIRHVSLLVDWMCYQGKLIPFTRFGLSQMSNSVLKLASFERVLHFVKNGAIDETHDECSGASEKIILGATAQIGTGKIDCFIDIEKCKNAIIPVETYWDDEMGVPFSTDGLPEFQWNDGGCIPPPPPPGMPPPSTAPPGILTPRPTLSPIFPPPPTTPPPPSTPPPLMPPGKSQRLLNRPPSPHIMTMIASDSDDSDGYRPFSSDEELS